jgi:hypothetical protein
MLRYLKKKQPHKEINEILLHHDNARLHVAHIIVNFLNARGIKTVLHPPYSPDLAPCDFWLFPEIKYPLRVGTSTAIKMSSKLWRRGTKSSRKMIWHSYLKNGKNDDKMYYNRGRLLWKIACKYGLLNKYLFLYNFFIITFWTAYVHNTRQVFTLTIFSLRQ